MYTCMCRRTANYTPGFLVATSADSVERLQLVTTKSWCASTASKHCNDDPISNDFSRARCYNATASLPITPWGSEEILYLVFAHKETTSFRLFFMGLSIIEQEAEAKGSQIISDQTMAVPNTLCQSKKKRVRICNALSLCPLECEVAGSLGIHHQSADSQVHSRLTLPPRSVPAFPDSRCYDVPRRLQVLDSSGMPCGLLISGFGAMPFKQSGL